MSKFNTLVIGIVNPKVKKYLSDYFASLRAQTDQEFDLLILNDHLDQSIFRKISKKIILVNIRKDLTPAEIRFRGIAYGIRHRYKNIIFTDTDDYFSENRFECLKDYLEMYDFVFNEIDLVNAKKVIFQSNFMNRLGVKPECKNVSEIINRNTFGLSNTAALLAKLTELYIPKEIIAVDWWIFTLLLLNGCRGGFVREAKTYYRQSENNLVGMGKELNEKRLNMGVKVKMIHYENLIVYCNDIGLKKEKQIYNNKFTEMVELSKEIKDSTFRKRYTEVINKNYERIFSGWWSEILPINEWRKYAE